MKSHSILPTPFFNFCPTPLPHTFLSTLTLTPVHPPFFLLSCFFGWMGDHTMFDVLFYLMIIWIYTCPPLVPQFQKNLDVCFMQQGVTFTEVWHIMWFFTGTLIWCHTHKHTAHLGAGRLTHPCKYIATFTTLND